MDKDRFEGWHTSSYTNGEGACVEVGYASTGEIGVRDTKLGAASPVETFPRENWKAFLADVKVSH